MLDLLYRRRSVRKFTDREIDESLVDELIQGLLLSPSSRGICPWEFVIVDDKDTIILLSDSKEHGSSFLAGAPMAVVVLGIPSASDVWIEDTSIASAICHLQTVAMGLGSCWIQIRGRKRNEHQTSEEYIKNILDIPEEYSVESIIAVGYPAEKLPSRTRKDLDFSKIHKNSFIKQYVSGD